MKKSVKKAGKGRPSNFSFKGTDTLGARIQQTLTARGRNATEVSVAIGAAQDFIRNIFRKEAEGKQHHPRSDKLAALARELGVDQEWLLEGDAGGHIESADVAHNLADHSRHRTVALVGYVGAGAEAHFYAISQGDLDRVPAPMDVTPTTVAVEIRGPSIGEMFDRWLVYYDDVRSPITQDLIGKLCVVGLSDSRILVKKIRRSKQQGRFDLLSENEAPIEAVTIEWAAKVKQMAPQ